MISVDRLVFDYPSKRALRGVSLEIAAGSITALVGPNGAGKTTLMRCLAGLEEPFSGSISVAGIDVFREPRAVHHEIGYLSDFFGLYDALSVRQCLIHAADSHGLSRFRRDQRIEIVAQNLGIADRLAARAGTLSRGLRQRLAIAQAMVHEPKVLLLDEPAAGLDPEARHDLSLLLRRLREGGMTIVVSSHILSELEDYSTDMLIMRDGLVLEQRPIGAARQATCEVIVEVADASDRLAAILSAAPGVEGLKLEGRTASFRFADDAAARADLLARLIGEGLAVAQFRVARQSLQDSYLNRVAAANAGAIAARGADAP